MAKKTMLSICDEIFSRWKVNDSESELNQFRISGKHSDTGLLVAGDGGCDCA